MLNSERIFSDSRTLNAIEDTFFRRAMAIYCENESKKATPLRYKGAGQACRSKGARPL